MMQHSPEADGEESQRHLLVRIDERTQILAREIHTLRATVAGMPDEIARKFVSQAEFTPVRNIVYGMVGLILLAVLGASSRSNSLES